MTPELFLDAVWWAIFNLVERLFFHTTFERNRKLLAMGCCSAADHWVPTNSRIACLVAIWDSGHWTYFQHEFRRRLIVLPFAPSTQMYIHTQFVRLVEPQLIEAIQHVLQDRADTNDLPMWVASSQRCLSDDLLSDSSSSSENNDHYIGTTSSSAQQRHQGRL